MTENQIPFDIEAMAIHYGPDIHPKAGVRIGKVILSLKEAEAYAIRILEACGDGREWDQADPIDVTCKTCGHTWATKQTVGSAVRCPAKCGTRFRIPIQRKRKS